MVTKVILFFALTFAVFGQTRVRPDQIRNQEQVRICVACGDDRSITLILQNKQTSDGRFKMKAGTAPQGLFMTDEDNNNDTACLASWIRIRMGISEGVFTYGYNHRSNVCFTQFGLMTWLMQGDNAVWFAAQP